MRAVGALRDLMARGEFDRPPAVQQAREEFARHIDQVRGFLSDRTDPGGWTERGELYEEYKRWAHVNGHGELGSRKFYERLRSAGVGEGKTGGHAASPSSSGQLGQIGQVPLTPPRTQGEIGIMCPKCPKCPNRRPNP